MLTIISIILIVLSLLVIGAILIKKFPALAILDVANIPGEKESKFKDKLMRQRVERDMSKFGGVLVKFWNFFSNGLGRGLKTLQARLKHLKDHYRRQEKLPLSTRRERIKELFLEVEEQEKKDDVEGAEANLIEIISLDQKNLKAFFQLAELYESDRKWVEAKETYTHALRLAKQLSADTDYQEEVPLAEIYFSLALNSQALDNIEAALDNVQEALEIEPNNPRYLDLILDLSIIKKDCDLAEKYLAKMAEVNPENNKLGDWREEIDSLLAAPKEENSDFM